MPADKLIQLVAVALDRDPATLNERSGPLSVESWDSLRHLMLIGMVEESYGVKFSAEEIEKATSVGKIRALLNGHGAS